MYHVAREAGTSTSLATPPSMDPSLVYAMVVDGTVTDKSVSVTFRIDCVYKAKTYCKIACTRLLDTLIPLACRSPPFFSMADLITSETSMLVFFDRPQGVKRVKVTGTLDGPAVDLGIAGVSTRSPEEYWTQSEGEPHG